MKKYGFIILILAITILIAGITIEEASFLKAFSVVFFIISVGIFHAQDVERGQRKD